MTPSSSTRRSISTTSSPELTALAEAVARRLNFAIISHPDAGKTTLTEKLLLYGGAIQQAGAVKAKGEQRKVTSDWMELEKQRGISITSTVLQFHYSGNTINLLDTPGWAVEAELLDQALEELELLEGAGADLSLGLSLLARHWPGGGGSPGRVPG